jgi:PadR family transcriptional regulator PadR
MVKAETKRKHAEFLILMALLDGPKHGYSISKYIEDKSNGFFRMPFGTLYPILHRLEKDAIVTVEVADQDSGRPQKIYKLTKTGKQQANTEIEGFELFSKATNRLVPT